MEENAVVYSIDLEAIKNVYLKSGLTFTTGKGTTVHVGGAAACGPAGGEFRFDKEKIFLALTTDRGESRFVRGMDIINWGFFYRGSGTAAIDGEKYVMKAYADISTPKNSKLVITGPSGAVLEATLERIGGAVAGKGVDVTLSKAYKLTYGNELARTGDGAAFTSRMLLFMVPFPVTSASPPHIIDVSAIGPSGATFASFEKRFGFRLNNGMLEIYPAHRLSRDA